MQIRYDPTDGLFLILAVYERDFAFKLLKLIRKELEQYDDDANADLVDAIIVAVAQNKGRRQ